MNIEKKRKSSWNLFTRGVSGVIFLLIMMGSMFIGPSLFAFVLLFSVAVMTSEHTIIFLGNKYKREQSIAVLSGATLFIISYLDAAFGISSSYYYLLVIPVTAIFVSMLFCGESRSSIVNDHYRKSGALFTSLIYIALPFSLINHILFDSAGVYNPLPILFLFILLWSSDVGAYLFGMAFGQKGGHKLAPKISPKKSWEGFFGGLFTAICSSIVIHYFGLLPFSLFHALVIAGIVVIFGVFGDLTESLLKRNFGIKDSGAIMPGHGGLLDRFDGALLAFPAAIAYVKLLSLI